jgi:hypothetical protein
MTKNNMVRFFIISAAAAGVFSCTDFFSTSLASWAARDPNSLIPPVTTGNVNDLVTGAENNPDLSLAVLKKIGDAVHGADADTASSLQAAALKAASNASGLGPALMNKMGQISELMENVDMAQDMVIDALNDMPNLEKTGAALAEVLPERGTPAFDAFVEKSSPDDLATAAAILLASEAKGEADNDDYIKNFDPSDPDISDSALLAVELAKAASQKMDDDGSNSRLKDVLGGLNLVPPTETGLP